jgi:hypothetical protein
MVSSSNNDYPIDKWKNNLAKRFLKADEVVFWLNKSTIFPGAGIFQLDSKKKNGIL